MKKNIVMAAGLAVALTMGTAPAAFAAASVGKMSEDPINLAEGETSGTTSTEVQVETFATQIDVSLPLTMTIAAPTGGGATLVPSENAYKITNKSSQAVDVQKVQATELDAGWQLSAAALTTESTSTATVGDLYMKLAPSAGTAWEVSTTEKSLTDWQIPAKTAATESEAAKDGELTFKITASNSKLNKALDKASKVFDLTYTVAIATPETPDPTPNPDPAPDAPEEGGETA